MSASNRTQDKSAKPAGLEDKSLAPAVEDKAAAPLEEDKSLEQSPEDIPDSAYEKPAPIVDPTDITLSTHYEYRGEHYNPGAEIVVDGGTAYGLIGGGFATAGHAKQS